MLDYYFKLAIRQIKTNITFSLINISGLAIGIASCILITLYVLNEFSYDKFHSKYENIYRINHTVQREAAPLLESATTFSRVAYELKQSYPTIEETCRLHKLTGNIAVQYDDNVFREDNVIGADTSFFRIFNFPFIYGSADMAMKMDRSVIITESISRKYFGEINPIGKEIIIDGAYGIYGSEGYNSRLTYIVNGVISDLPANTHLSFDFLISFRMYSNLEGELNNWGDSFYSYIKLSDPLQMESISAGLLQVTNKYRPDQGVVLSLQEMQGIHLTSNLTNEIKANGSRNIALLLAALAIVILVVASTNYINFSTAKIIDRQKEVGIRRIYWANSRQLIYQLLFETLILNVFSLVVALVLIFGSQPYIIPLFGLDISYELASMEFWIVLFLVLISGTLISGLYPAYIISKLKIEHVSGASNSGSSRNRIRNSLIVFQFSISMIVIGFAFILFSQMDYMKNTDLGLNIENTFVINGPSVDQENDSVNYVRQSIFKVEAEKLGFVEQVSLANFVPGKEIRGKAASYVRRLGESEESAGSYYFTQIDYDFAKYFDLNLVAGRAFNRESAADVESIIINEKASQVLGFLSAEESIGQKINYRMNSTPTIIGVVNNFHQYSLQREFQPIIFEVRENPDNYFFLQFSESNTAGILELEKLWKQVFPGNPYSYFYLDDFFVNQYKKEDQFLSAFGAFSVLAILVGSIGFFGLVYYKSASKIKEIGIRKTLGAGIGNIFAVISKGFGGIILISSAIGVTVLHFISDQWLSNYAFRIDIQWWMLLAPVTLLVMISLVIVAIMTIKANMTDPVISLKED